MARLRSIYAFLGAFRGAFSSASEALWSWFPVVYLPRSFWIGVGGAVEYTHSFLHAPWSRPQKPPMNGLEAENHVNLSL